MQLRANELEAQLAKRLLPAYVIHGDGVPAGLPIGLVVWLGIFVALATVAVRSTAESV